MFLDVCPTLFLSVRIWPQMILLKGKSSPLVSIEKSRLSSKLVGTGPVSKVNNSNFLRVFNSVRTVYGLTGILLFLESSDCLKFSLSESSDSVTPASFWPSFQLLVSEATKISSVHYAKSRVLND